MKRAAGPFEILEILGEGSFGTVCVARVTGDPLRRKVALKILKGAYTRNQKILNRTRDEARLLSRINHPNIVRVERLMDVGGRPVVVMEHVQGVSLDQLLLRFKDGIPGSVAIELVRQTCLALHVAFNEAVGDDGRPLRVIHRDIKPSNILLSIHGEVKVVDFGIAKGEFEGREADTQSVVMGSRPYMAPERLDGISDSPAVDVYSSGMSLFELLTGRTMSLSINPVTHDQAMNRQLAYLQIEGMPQQALEDLRGIVRKMCAYDRDFRPSSIDVIRDLEQCIYAIDPTNRIGLEEFARTTVLPIYESRPKISPEDAAQTGNDDEFLREVTGQLTGSNPTRTAGLIAWTPYMFVGLLVLMVGVLGAAAGVKAFVSGGGGVLAPYDPTVPDDGKIAVKVWLPQQSQAQIGADLLRTSGTVRLFPGAHVMELYYDSGWQRSCSFAATEGVVIAVDDDGIKVGTSPTPTACDEITPRPEPGGDAAGTTPRGPPGVGDVRQPG